MSRYQFIAICMFWAINNISCQAGGSSTVTKIELSPVSTTEEASLPFGDGVWFGENGKVRVAFIVDSNATHVLGFEWAARFSNFGMGSLSSLFWYYIPINDGFFSYDESWGERGEQFYGEFMNYSSVQGRFTYFFHPKREYLDWKAHQYIADEGYPHNGMWCGITEQNTYLYFVIAANGRCFSQFSALLLNEDATDNFGGAGFTLISSLFSDDCYFGDIVENHFFWSTSPEPYFNFDWYVSFSGEFISGTLAKGVTRIIIPDGYGIPGGWDSGEIFFNSVYGYLHKIDNIEDPLKEAETIISKEYDNHSIVIKKISNIQN